MFNYLQWGVLSQTLSKEQLDVSCLFHARPEFCVQVLMVFNFDTHREGPVQIETFQVFLNLYVTSSLVITST